MGRATVYAACAASALLGLLFIFVRAPHPWGWEGFDHYHDLGLVLARGGTFPTTDVPWGYAYFLAPFYRAFGDRPWIPLVVQAGLNALLPLLVYRFARDAFGERIAVAAAVVTGLCSFNTVYASTQSSDAVCTVLFMSAVVAFAAARRHGEARLYALAGALSGLASQFRPNLILVPFVLAGLLVLECRSRRGAVRGLVILAGAGVMLAPWLVRNYRLAGELIPTSTHGGQQLWYGTLQSGPYLKSRAYNPRRVFEHGSFPYTSLDRVPLILTWPESRCAVDSPPAIEYWTDRDPVPQRVAATISPSGERRAELPPAAAPTAYYFRMAGSQDPPQVVFISTDHLTDIDRHGDLLDVFDVVRMMRHAAWNEPLANAARLDFDRDGRVTEADTARAAGILLAPGRVDDGTAAAGRVVADADRTTLRFDDGSSMTVPRDWSGRVTDLEVSGAQAERLLHGFTPFAALQAGPSAGACAAVDPIAVNDVFYRAEPHAMRRYTALAFDNIGRDPAAYLAGVAYRAARVFFIEGNDDAQTVQQFPGGRRVYQAAYAASVLLFGLFAGGVWIAWRRGIAIVLPLVLIAYIPATLAFVLTNMRYSVTVQPLMFVFVATTLVTGWDAIAARPSRGRRAETAGRRRGDGGTARPL